MRGENQENRELVKIVLWHGQYVADAKDVLSILDGRLCSSLNVYDIHIEGHSGDWRIVGVAFKPLERPDMRPL